MITQWLQTKLYTPRNLLILKTLCVLWVVTLIIAVMALYFHFPTGPREYTLMLE